jgi:hypothetical protein
MAGFMLKVLLLPLSELFEDEPRIEVWEILLQEQDQRKIVCQTAAASASVSFHIFAVHLFEGLWIRRSHPLSWSGRVLYSLILSLHLIGTSHSNRSKAFEVTFINEAEFVFNLWKTGLTLLSPSIFVCWSDCSHVTN